MGVQDDEILKMYVEESQEHLADIENDLLLIEEAGADIDEDLVNKVFRAAHSLKGGAGFMGLNIIKDLSHKIENILGMIRSREVIPNPEIINILLLAFDKLRELINNVDQSNEMDISEHTTALIELTADSLPKEEKEGVTKTVDIKLPEGKTIFNVSEFDISQSRKEGKYIYITEFDLIHDVHNKGKTPLDILAAMQESGLVIESRIDMAAVGNLAEEESANRIPFLVVFASIIDPDVIHTIFDVDEKNIRIVSEDLTIVPIKPISKGSPESIKNQEEIKIPEDTKQSPAKPLLEKEITPKDAEISETSAGIFREDTGIDAEVSPYQKEGETIHAGVALSGDDEEKSINNQTGSSSGMEVKSTQPESSLRVHVSLLDNLMTLAGELVLSRNQLLQAVTSQNKRSLELVSQKVDMITSELQETIMLTRMQPIGNIFNKFPRVVRDLARNLGKKVDLILEGKDVELDKTIIEGLSDPLTHLVRNSVDHGVESPQERKKASKDAVGLVILKAYHEAGQVNIEISDNGKGLDGDILAKAAINKSLLSEEQARIMSDKEKVGLIFLPGFSTAKEVTDVSGRGVGMDVVKTNLDSMGGEVDIDSKVGEGTTIRIKLPLTLAIIPSQIISVGGEYYAIPQVNLDELLRISADQVKDKIETVGGAEVVRLRGNLLPLLSLAHVLGTEKIYEDTKSGEIKPDRREKIANRRSVNSSTFKDDSPPEEVPDHHKNISAQIDRRVNPDRRFQTNSAVNIAVVSAGNFKYGLAVDKFYDSEEIVVKPMGRHLNQCHGYAGATIMGDGRVALILDVPSLARMAELTSLEGTDRADDLAKEIAASRKDEQSLLVFRSSEDEQFAAPLSLVERIEKVKKTDIEYLGDKKVVQYRGASLPLFAIEEVANVKPLADKENYGAIVFKLAGKEIGLLATPPIDALEAAIEVDDTTLTQTGIMGSFIIDDNTTLMLNIFEMVESLNPEWFVEREAVQTSEGEVATILYAEDSRFFRNQVKGFMEDDGYHVIEAEDGAIAWDLLQEHADNISIVITDIEMPNLDGFSLTEKIKGDERFSTLPVIAMTTLAGDNDIARGKEVGIDDYQIKLDKEKLMDSIHNYLEKGIGC